MDKEIKPLHIDVRGSNGINFSEGLMTGNMTEYGISIGTVWWSDNKKIYGGCIDREEAKQIRDWFNLCLKKWENEGDN